MGIYSTPSEQAHPSGPRLPVGTSAYLYHINGIWYVMKSDGIAYEVPLSSENVQDIVGPMMQGTAPITVTYNDALNKVIFTLGQIDHGSLSGLGDDDHAQYLNNSRGDGRYYTKIQIDDSFLNYLTTSAAASTYAPIAHAHIVANITDFDLEVEQKIVSTIYDGNGIISSYDNQTNKITLSVDQTELSHLNFQGVGTNTHAQIDTHLSDTSNPHSTTASQIGADTFGTASGLMLDHTSALDPHPQYAEVVDLSDVATSGDYNDLNNTPSIIPFINSPTPNATGQFLYWDSVQQKFRPTTGGWAFDVLTQPMSGQLLQYTLTGSRFNLSNVGDVLAYGNISDLANVTNDSPTNGQVLTYDSTQGAWKPATNASANIFGSEFQEQTRDTLASTTSTTPLLYTSFTKTVPAGKYRIGAFIIWNLSTTTSNFISQLKINGSIIGEMSIEANESGTDIRTPSTGFFYYTAATPQTVEVEIYFNPQTNGITARMYYAILEFWRVQ